MTVLTWLIVYCYHGASSAAFPNYIISVDGPIINTCCIKAGSVVSPSLLKPLVIDY